MSTKTSTTSSRSSSSSLGDVLTKKIEWDHVHGMFSISFMILSLIEIIQFSWTHQPCHALTLGIVVSALAMALGLPLSSKFRNRLMTLGKRKYFFIRTSGWLVAYSGLSISMYTLTEQQDEDSYRKLWLSKDYDPPTITSGFTRLPLLYRIGTCLWIVGVIVWILSAQYEIRHCTFLEFAPKNTNRTKDAFVFGFVMANVASSVTLVGMPLLHAGLLGPAGMQGFYSNYHPAKSIYIVSVMANVIQAYDSFMIGLLTAGRIQRNMFDKYTGKHWPLLYVPAVSIYLWLLHHSWKVSLASYLFHCSLFPLSKILAKWATPYMLKTKGKVA